MSDYRTRPPWALDIPAADLPTREAAAKLLAMVMSDISETYYCAGWLIGLEDDLWNACAEVKAYPYGMGAVQPDEVLTLRVLASLAGGWVGWAEGDGPDALGENHEAGRHGRRFVPWTAKQEDPAMLVEEVTP